jgi:hypothetical protein
MALPRAITIISLALMAAARIRTKVVRGTKSFTDGIGMESLRWRFERESVDHQLLGPDGLICHAEDSIGKKNGENRGKLDCNFQNPYECASGLPR